MVIPNHTFTYYWLLSIWQDIVKPCKIKIYWDLKKEHYQDGILMYHKNLKIGVVDQIMKGKDLFHFVVLKGS